jgi:RNA polymerase sigma factor (sigma-70 family)
LSRDPLDGRDDNSLEHARPALVALAYRMLGSRTEAEDAVQDTFMRWQEVDRADVRNPVAWLTTTCTRRCIDMLKAAERQRVDYIGVWLPEAVHAPLASEDVAAMSLASSLSTAFLLMLERLSPKERAAYLLHDVFELPYPRIAETLALPEATCRKLVSRARANVGEARVRADPPPVARQEALLAAFQVAIDTGDATELATMLSEDVEIRHDTGGKVGAAVHVLQGRANVVDFIRTFLHRVWSRYQWTATGLNGSRGVLLAKDGKIVTAVSIGFGADGKATHIYILRNPEKLARLAGPAIHSWKGRLA